MHRRYGLTLTALVLLAALLTACGGSKATSTPASPTIAPTTAAGSGTAATGPAGSAVTTGSSAPATASSSAAASATRPAGSATSATTGTSATASTVAVGSSVTGTRPAGSVTVGGTTAAGSAAAGGALTVFTDPKGRFTFSRPAAWVVSQSTGAQTVVQFNSTNPLGVIDISTETAPPGITTDTLLTLALTEVKKTIPDAQQVGTLPLQVGGEQAMQIDYTGTVSGNKIYFSQIYTIHSGTVYVLTLGVQPADIDRMKQQAVVVVQTWKFLQ